MQSSSQLVWGLAGEPGFRKPASGDPCACAVCGVHDDTPVPANKAMGTNFASHGELACQSSDGVCRACAWALTGKPPDTIRLWSIVARGDVAAPPNTSPKARDMGPHVHLTSRADLRWAVETLLSPPDCPWVVSIATSGQKHILPFAAVNHGEPWVMRLESVDVAGTPERLASMLYVAGQLMALGFYGSEILSGNPNTGRLIKAGIDIWRAADAHLQPERGGPLLELAVITPNKEHNVEITERARQELERRGVDIVGRGLHLGDPAVGRLRRDRPTQLVGPGKDGAGDSGKLGGGIPADGQSVWKETPSLGTARHHQQGDLFNRVEAGDT